MPSPVPPSIGADAQLVARGVLQAPCASFFLPATAPCQGVVLLLHGYSAGPWQFAEVAAACAAAGLHAYAARLPGHGAQRTDGRESWQELPRAAQAALYAAAGADAFTHAAAIAQAEQVPLHVFGFSLGGAIALDLALQHPEAIGRLILAAPMLRPTGRGPWLLYRGLRLGGRLGTNLILDRLPLSWGALPAPPADGWVRPGHWFFRVGNMYAVLDYGASLALHKNPLQVPTQLFTTSNDRRCDPRPPRDFLKNSSAPHFAFNFPESAGVPHAMLSSRENPNVEARQFLQTIAVRFLLSGIGADSVS